MLQGSINEAAKDNRRKAEVFRKGVVSKVDESVTPNRVTVAGRAMPSVNAGLVVGDVVVYVDQADPFTIGKFAGT